jgi:hypothetical protein
MWRSALPCSAQETVKGKLHIVGYQLTAVERRFVVPFDAFMEMENIGGVVWRFPAFGQMGSSR